jgi:acetolactate synthase-1/2/3 large subunit
VRVVDAICEILKREGVTFLSCYPTNPVIEAAAVSGIRPIVCRQERVGVGIADGFSRVSNGRSIGVFTMQNAPGAENAFSGIATAYSDSVPILALPLGYARDMAQAYPFFKSSRTYSSVVKSVEEINLPERTQDVMRHAFTSLRIGPPGPVMVEIPADVAIQEFDARDLDYKPVKPTRVAADPTDVAAAARILLDAKSPVVYAGQEVLYAEASEKLVQLAEFLRIPVLTTLEGKSGFPEDHPLSLGTASSPSITGAAYQFLCQADVLLAIGSLTKHGITTAPVPPGKILIHSTNDEREINKHYAADHALLGDARLVLSQLIEALKDLAGDKAGNGDSSVAREIQKIKEPWLAQWMPKLTSDQIPINPFRVFWEFMHAVDLKKTIVTHDSGSTRNQMAAFYPATTPRSYIGWGKSHGLGTGLGLIIGAKLAAPDKFCANFMGDGAFGMTGLDFETAVRAKIPILTVVLNNSAMACETRTMAKSHELFKTREVTGNYAEIGRALGGYAERVEKPQEIAPAIKRAKQATEEGRAALLEFITCEETSHSSFAAMEGKAELPRH